MKTPTAKRTMDMSIHIRKAENGVILRYDDPKIAKQNEESDKYVDADVELVFKSTEEAMPEIQRVLKLMGGDDSSGELEEAFEEASDD